MTVELIKQGDLISLDSMSGVMLALGDWLPDGEGKPILTIETDPKAEWCAIKSGERSVS